MTRTLCFVALFVAVAFATTVAVAGCDPKGAEPAQPTSSVSGLTSSTGVVVPEQPTSAIQVQMTGSEVVPPVQTNATGRAMLYTNDLSFGYRVDVQNLRDPESAVIRLGISGSIGPVVAELSGGLHISGTVTGTLCEGILSEKDFMGPMAGKMFRDLVQALNEGRAYVEVTTKTHPAGELRGQVPPVPRS